MKAIGKYQVVEEVGASATGKTYRAQDRFRNREFAVKILESAPGLTADTKAQLCNHLASCAELTHRHIAKAEDLGEVEEGVFVATAWRPGLQLGQFMLANRDLPLDQKLGPIAQVAEGLAYAHSRGISHGNLKPSNILVDHARDIAILDFGTAKWLAALIDAGRRPEGLLANYLAPEQVLGQPFDERSDIFALGLMLYEFAAGKYPFSAEPGLIPREIVHSEPQPLRSLDPKIPQGLEELVARALKKDPAQRLQNAEEFASGLYLAAQQARRAIVAAQMPAAGPPSSETLPAPSTAEQAKPTEPSEPVVFNQPPSQPSNQSMVAPPIEWVAANPVSSQATTPPPLQQAVPMSEGGTPPQRVRERPQDAEPAPRPWSARSYAAGSSRPPVTVNVPPKQPGASTPPPSMPSEPVFVPPKSFLKPEPLPALPIPPRQSKLGRNLLIAGAGLVLAVSIIGSLVSRQNLHASTSKKPATIAAEQRTPAAESKPDARLKPSSAVAAQAPEPREARPSQPGPDDFGNPQFSARQTLNGPVRTYWESGRYAQALTLVNQVLVNDPDNEEARSWRKKIREAQAAEAALK